MKIPTLSAGTIQIQTVNKIYVHWWMGHLPRQRQIENRIQRDLNPRKKMAIAYMVKRGVAISE
jgi:hypothetical protein